MNFLQDCARRLEGGEDANMVLQDMKTRYTTVRALNVKTCLVRGMCESTDEYKAVQEHNRMHPDDRKTLPHRVSTNVQRLKVTREEMKACKRLQTQSAVKKNMRMLRVDGRGILDTCRCTLQQADVASIPLLALSLMLLTGRRTCEILNGQSTFTRHDRFEYAIVFCGQAKRRHKDVASFDIPVLACPDVVLRAMSVLRSRTGRCEAIEDSDVNQKTSRRYQSWLSRTLRNHTVLAQAGHPHSLRGVYACMCTKLFNWEDDYAPAYIAMRVLGHCGLQESLVYTPYHLGDDFASEPMLGRMALEGVEEHMDAKQQSLSSGKDGLMQTQHI